MRTGVKHNGAVALITVIVITALTLVSIVVIALVNATESLSNFQSAQSQQINVDIEACVDDALWRINSSTSVTGTFYLFNESASCEYQIAETMSSYKTVTSTASSTNGLGSWYKSIVMQVNVSTTPITIESYLDNTTMYCGDSICNNSEDPVTCASDCGSGNCGDGWCVSSEDCDNCAIDCGACVCGNGITEPNEDCDDGNSDNTDACTNSCIIAFCGDAIIRSGVENCEYTSSSGNYCPSSGQWCGNCADATVDCPGKESSQYNCINCVTSKLMCMECV